MIGTVQSLWIGPELSLLEQLCIRSFLAHGHVFHLYTYGNVAGVPAGTVIRDANEILPESSMFRIDGSIALFADWFRWELLFGHGGCWVDMDLVCLRPFDFDDRYLFGRESADMANIAVLGFPAGDEMCGLLAQNCANPGMTMVFDGPKERRRKQRGRWFRQPYRFINWGDIGGPRAFTRAIRHFDRFGLAKPYTCFYPIPPGNWDAFFLEDVYPDQSIGEELFANSYTIHVWNEFFRREKVDKNADFPPGSLFEKLKRRYL